MSTLYNFTRLAPVPTATSLIDIVLSKTQRKTPTVVHPGYNITRIRNFYARKVKFAQEAFEEKVNGIVQGFPILDDIHPFYSDLINVLYDRDHYKLALGQCNTAKHLIEQIAKDYVRLLKFGDSLFRCKQLKRAALGRMATLIKGLKSSLVYLEQVRQHLARLPSIDPNTRTLLLTGYPNVGKSSFMNKITRANVEVQPYAFTTKSLYVGHMDFKYLRWQVIDTPGILDHPLEDRNTIEMQSITALAHLTAAVLYFMDLSEQCGFSISEQAKLFHSIKPLFANKSVILVINKIDARKPEDLDPSNMAILQTVMDAVTETVMTSCHTEEGVIQARDIAAEKLLIDRVDSKLRTSKVAGVANRLHLSVPVARDEKVRATCIPDAVKERMIVERKTMRDLERENGGAGVFNFDLKMHHQLENPEWLQDTIPEIMDGRNISDYFDSDIQARLEALDEEEERLEAAGFYKEMPKMTSEERSIAMRAQQIRDKKAIIVAKHRLTKGKNRPVITKRVTAQDFDESFDAPLDVPVSRKRKSDEMEGIEVARETGEYVEEVVDAGKASQKIKHASQKKRNLLAKAGEGDRTILTKMPRHLFAGKRKAGKTDRR